MQYFLKCMNNRFHPTFYFIFFILIVGCDQRDLISDGDIILAEAGDQVLLLSDVTQEVSYGENDPDSLLIIEKYRNRWINQQLKVKEAERLGIDEHPQVARRIERSRESILADAFNELIYLEVKESDVTPEEAQTYYEANKELFVLSERHIRYRHMICATLSDAENARNAIRQGQSWRSVVNNYSVNPDVALRHSRQYWPISSAGKEYELIKNFLNVIGVSEISPIRRIGNHFHFVQIMDSRDAGEHPEINWILEQISEWLLIEKRRKKIKSIEQKLFRQAEANKELKIFDLK